MLGIAVGGSCFVWLVISNFIIRVVADPRMGLSQEMLAAVAARFPNSPRANFRLADTELADATSKGRFNAQAEVHAARAVNLSPWDYQSRRLLAIAQELNNRPEEAENSLRAAVRLAPNHADLNWVLANLLLRRGKLNESLEPFRVASAADFTLLPAAVETIWQSSGGNPEALKTFAGGETEAQLAVVKFLVEQKLVTEAVAIFNTIDKQARVNSPRGPELVTTLIGAGQVELARNVWVEMVTALSPNGPPGRMGQAGSLSHIWNGGFEADPVKNFNHFDWAINPNQYARIAIDRGLGRSGSHSLKVAFTGLDTTTLTDEVKQAVVLKPGLRYRLECYARASELVTSEGPRVAIFGQSKPMAVSEPVSSGSGAWQHLVVEFVAPDDGSLAVLKVVRIPKFSYDDPTRGVVWFDDFTLTAIQ
jgi:tetratricopeptide (TPR) repeat protein